MNEWHDWLGLGIAAVLVAYWMALLITARYPLWRKIDEG